MFQISPAIKLRLLEAFEQGASDVHLSSTSPPMIRLNGALQAVASWQALPELMTHWWLHTIDDQDKKQLLEGHAIDAALTLQGDCRVRVNAFAYQDGVSLACRFIGQHVPSLSALHAPDALYDFCQARQGLVLITGATGTGKTTTLAAMIDWINQHQGRHIITLEDPIEVVHRSQQSLIHQREVGRDCHGFVEGLRSALRQDPDVILIGELRDASTIKLALTAAETGHLVFATLHANSAASTVHRVVDACPHQEQSLIRHLLAHALIGIVSQQLLPVLDRWAHGGF